MERTRIVVVLACLMFTVPPSSYTGPGQGQTSGGSARRVSAPPPAIEPILYTAVPLESVPDIEAVTIVGHLPRLPKTIPAVYQGKAKGPEVRVVWPAPKDNTQVLKPGTYSVTGKVPGTSFQPKASVTVKAASNIPPGPARLIEPFPLGGWDSRTTRLRGHATGHYLSAIAQAYAGTTYDEALRAEFLRKMNALIDALYDLSRKSGRPAQEGEPFNADPTAVPPGPGRAGYDSNLRAGAIRTDYWNWGRGFISAYPPDQFIMLEQGAAYGTQDSQIWAPYYTLHKLLAGLLDCYEVGGNGKALEIAKDMAGWVHARLKILPVAATPTTASGGCPSAVRPASRSKTRATSRSASSITTSTGSNWTPCPRTRPISMPSTGRSTPS